MLPFRLGWSSIIKHNPLRCHGRCFSLTIIEGFKIPEIKGYTCFKQTDFKMTDCIRISVIMEVFNFTNKKIKHFFFSYFTK